MNIKLLLLFFILVFSTISEAQLQLIGRVMPGEANATFVMDSLCYLAAGNQLQIFNINNPAAPNFIGYIDLPEEADDIYIDNDFAYIAVNNSGFAIVNLTDKKNPQIVSITDIGTSVYGIFYQNFKVFLATRDSGLVIYDVSNPQSTFKLGVFNAYRTIWPTLNVYVQNNYAFVAAGYDGFSIIDVSNPANPQMVYLYDVQGFWAYDIKVSAEWAYLSFDTYDSGAGLLTFLIPTDPTDTQQIGYAPSNAPARRIDIGGGYAYLACGRGGLNIIDISNPHNPNTISNWVQGYSNNLFYSNNYVYLADKFQGLYVLNVANANNIVLEGKYDTHSYSTDIAIKGNYLYEVERDPSNLKIFDISDKSKPILLYDEILYPDLGGVAAEVSVIDNYLFLSTYATLTGGDHQFRWYKLNDPLNPELIGIFDKTMLGIRSFDIQGDKAYIGNSSNLRVLDLSVEQNPIPMLGYFSNNYDNITGIEVRGTLAYLATRTTGFRIVNIEHPSSMFEVGYLNTNSETFDLDVQNNTAYLADWEAGFKTVDISDPSQPVLLDAIEIAGGEARSVSVKNDIAYVAWDNGELRLYDVSDPTNIKELQSFETGSPQRIRFNNDYVYVADDGQGIYLFKYEVVSSIDEKRKNPLPHDFYLAQNYPNPFNPSTSIEFYIPQSGKVSLKIYNITGQVVKTLVNKELTAGSYKFYWDGTDNTGNKVTSGVYVYSLNYKGQYWTRKMILLR